MKKTPKDLWEIIPLDLDIKRVRCERLVPVKWKWGNFTIKRYTEFSNLEVYLDEKCIGSHFLDLNSAKQYVFRFLETGGFPNAENDLKTLCDMTSFYGNVVFRFMKQFPITIKKKKDEDNEVYYEYCFDGMDKMKCDSVYEVAQCIQTDYLMCIGFDTWNGNQCLAFIRKNTEQKMMNDGEQHKLMKKYELKSYSTKW